MPQPAPLVCLVDSDPATRRSVPPLLRRLGAEVAVYSTAQEFLVSIADRLPACLIADTRLPDMSGLALLVQLRAHGIGIPAILLSSDDDVTGAVAAMRAGAIDCIEKPFIDRVLANQVAKILGRDARAQ